MNKNILCLYKTGKFYNAYGDNGLIIHYFMGYKYADIKNSVGFPESAYNKVKGILEKNNISYIVYEKSNVLDEYKGITSKYQKCLKEAIKNYSLEKRLNRIKEKLDKMSLEELEKVLETIEFSG